MSSSRSTCEASRPRRSTVVLATCDERENVQRLIPELLRLDPHLDVVVVDDASPDGTAAAVEEAAAAFPGRVRLVSRPAKLGYGSAVVAGFRAALQGNPDAIVSVDADFSHDPRALPGLLAGLASHDVVIGSRYLAGVRILNWSLWRLVLSRVANVCVKLLLPSRITDRTSGYRAYRAEVLPLIEFEAAESNGYAFLVELLGCYAIWTFLASRHLFRVATVLLLACGRAAAASSSRGGDRRLLGWVVAWGVALGLLFFGADLSDSLARREAVRRAAQELTALGADREGERVWYAGHWDFRFYAESLGMKPVVPGSSRLEEGDWLLVPEGLSRQQFGIPPGRVRQEAFFESRSPSPWSSIPSFYAGPISLRSQPEAQIAVRVHRVERGFRATGRGAGSGNPKGHGDPAP